MPIVYVTRSPYPFEAADDKCEVPANPLANDHWCEGDFASAPGDQHNWLNPPTGLLSPDGKWVASACDNEEYPTLKVGRVGMDPTWQITFGEAEIEAYVGRGTYYPYRWSLDGRYLYFAALNYDVSNPVMGMDGYALFRLDTDTFEVNEVLPHVGGYQNPYNFAFSPDMDSIAYSIQADTSPKLTIRSMRNGQSIHFRLDRAYGLLGELIWSPENDRLFGLAWKQGETGRIWDSLYTLFLFDLNLQTQTTFYPDISFTLFPFRWDSEHGAIFMFPYPMDMGYYPWFSYDDIHENWKLYYQLDPDTGETKNIPPAELFPTQPD